MGKIPQARGKQVKAGKQETTDGAANRRGLEAAWGVAVNLPGSHWRETLVRNQEAAPKVPRDSPGVRVTRWAGQALRH